MTATQSLTNLSDRVLIIQQQEVILELVNSSNQAVTTGAGSSTQSSNQSYENTGNLSQETLSTLIQNSTTGQTTSSSDHTDVRHLLHHLFHNLISAVNSGNLADAQTAYQSLLTELKQLGIDPTSQTTGASTPSSTATTTTTPSDDDTNKLQNFLSVINQIGTALNSNSISQAQSIVSQLHHGDQDQGDHNQGNALQTPDLHDLLQSLLKALETQSPATGSTQNLTPVSQNSSGTPQNLQEFAVFLYESNSSLSVTNNSVTLNNSTTEIALVG